ncbi:hypothetical protein D3C84_767070 [compost metagenome]
MQATKHRRRTAGPGALPVHGTGRGVGQDATQAGNADKQWDQQWPQLLGVHRSDGQQRQAGTDVDPDCAAQQKRRGTLGQQARIDLRHQDESRRIGTEQPAEMLGRHAVELDKHKGGTGNVGKHPGDSDAPCQGVAEKHRVRQQPTVLTQRPGQRLAWHMGGHAFR